MLIFGYDCHRSAVVSASYRGACMGDDGRVASADSEIAPAAAMCGASGTSSARSLTAAAHASPRLRRQANGASLWVGPCLGTHPPVDDRWTSNNGCGTLLQMGA